jgi:hypothetical protein
MQVDVVPLPPEQLAEPEACERNRGSAGTLERS